MAIYHILTENKLNVYCMLENLFFIFLWNNDNVEGFKSAQFFHYRFIFIIIFWYLVSYKFADESCPTRFIILLLFCILQFNNFVSLQA